MSGNICPICGDGNLKITGSIVASKMMLPRMYEFMKCGHVGFPLKVDSEEDAIRFREMKRME